MTIRIGVDIGGTFTDLVVYDDTSHELLAAKGPTVSEAPEQGVLNLIHALSPSMIQDTRSFLHGTTVGLNALLERKGGIVGLLTTRGFRDILELRRGERAEMFNLHWRPEPPLVPRRLRLEVTERTLADGSIETRLDETDVLAALRSLEAAGAESIALVFLNAHANPSHERRTAEILRELGYRGDIALSHEVSGEYREYERTSTTVIDAYVRPHVAQYLQRLETGLQNAGVDAQMLVTRSGGGAMAFADAATRPFETIMSGPVAGAVGASVLCRQLDVSLGVMADVGGTSFDTCLILDGVPQTKHEGSVVGMPLQCSWVDVRSIGAGGGSVAFVDAGGLLRAGPESAGAWPGPACYGRGGKLPTATDAACYLGMLGSGDLAGGLKLQPDRAEASLKPLARTLSVSVGQLAQGVIKILTSSMANAIRSVTLEQGHDPRDAALIAFGGAGPLFACLMLDELQAAEAIIPPFAGNFSALGLLSQDITKSASLTFLRPLSATSLQEANGALANLSSRLSARTARSEAAAQVSEAALDIRYAGQEHTLTIPTPLQDQQLNVTVDDVHATFTSAYTRTFGHALDGELEIVTLRHTLRTPLPRLTFSPPVAGADSPATTVLDAFSFEEQSRVPFRVISRAAFAAGGCVSGPAIVAEGTCTTYVDVGYRLVVDPTGALRISRNSGG